MKRNSKKASQKEISEYDDTQTIVLTAVMVAAISFPQAFKLMKGGDTRMAGIFAVGGVFVIFGILVFAMLRKKKFEGKTAQQIECLKKIEKERSDLFHAKMRTTIKVFVAGTFLFLLGAFILLVSKPSFVWELFSYWAEGMIIITIAIFIILIGIWQNNWFVKAVKNKQNLSPGVIAALKKEKKRKREIVIVLLAFMTFIPAAVFTNGETSYWEVFKVTAFICLLVLVYLLHVQKILFLRKDDEIIEEYKGAGLFFVVMFSFSIAWFYLQRYFI